MDKRASLHLKVILALTIVFFASLLLINTISADKVERTGKSGPAIMVAPDNGMADVIITFKEGVSVTPQTVLTTTAAASEQIYDLSIRGMEIKEKFPIVNGIHVLIPKSQLEALKNSPIVDTVELNELRYHALLDTSVPLINGDDAQSLGYNGSGIKVCVIDTGIDFWHNNLPAPAAKRDFTDWDWCIDTLEHASVSGQSRSYNFSLNITNTSITWLEIGANWGNSGNRYDIYVYYPNGTLANATTMSVVNELWTTLNNVKNEAWNSASNTSNYTLVYKKNFINTSVVVVNDTTVLDSSNYTVYDDGNIILNEPSYVGANLIINYSYNGASNSTNYTMAHNLIAQGTVVVKNDTTTLDPSNYTVYYNDGKIILTEPSYIGENLTINYSYRYAVISYSGLYYSIVNLTNTTPWVPGENWTIVLNETNITASSDYSTIFWGANVTNVSNYYTYDYTQCVINGDEDYCGCSVNSPVGIAPRTFYNIHWQDDNGHGSHVAGIIASNNTTYKGVAPNVTLYIAKVLDTTGLATTTAIVNGIQWCINQSVDIMSISLGAGDLLNCNYTDVRAIDNATINYNILSVIAAGNGGPTSGTIAEPGCAKTALTVGATDDIDGIASFSSRGPTSGTVPKRVKPDVTAPGVSIYSTFPTNSIKSIQGTSQATPHVAGIAALLKQKNSSLTASEVKAIIIASSNKTSLYNDNSGDFDPNNKYGAGRVDALKAVNATLIKTINISSGQILRYKMNVTSSSKDVFVALNWNENLTDTHNNVILNLTMPNLTVIDTSTNSNNTIQQVGKFSPQTGIWTVTIQSISGTTNKTVAIASTYALYQAPEVYLISPTNNTATNKSSVNFTYRVYDSNFNISYCSLWANFSGTWQENQSNLTPVVNQYINNTHNSTILNNFTASGLGEGLYIWNIQCNNTDGKTGINATNYTLRVDASPPVITLNSPVDNYNTSGNITLNWSVSDLSLSKVWYSINKTANVSTSSWSGNATYVLNISVSNGLNQNITFYANDTFGNTNSTTRVFNIDRNAPNLKLIYPINSTVVNSNVTDLNYTSSDNYVLNTTWYQLEGGSPVTLSGNTTVNLDFPGEYQIDLYANDSVNNTNHTIVIFTTAFNMNMSKWVEELRTHAPEITGINVSLDGLDITTNESTSVNGNVTINITTANFNITFLNFSGLGANWVDDFNVTETSANVTNTISLIGSNASKLIYLSNASNFLADAEYNGTVTFSGNLSNYTEFYYCASDTIFNSSHCSKVSACSGAFNGTACYNESADSTKVYVPHFSAVVAANDTKAPTITVNSPTNGTTYTSSLNVSTLMANLTTSADTVYCNMSLLANGSFVTGNDSKINTSSTSGSISYVWQIGPLHNGNYNITFYCNDSRTPNTTVKYFNVNDTTKPVFLDVNATPSKTTAWVDWEADEPINATINYGLTKTSLTKNVTSSTFSKISSYKLSGLNDDDEYFYNFTGCDYSGNCKTAGPYNFTTAKAEENSSNEGGEGGGGGGGGENQTNTTSKSQTWSSINASSLASMNIDTATIPVSKISFTLSNSTTNGQLTVKGLSSLPAGLGSPPNTAYQYFSITASTGIKNNLISAAVRFRVLKSFFTDNNYNSSTVTLYNNNGTSWEKLGTTLKDNTGSYNTYEASTSHFSTFAITMEANEGQATNDTTNQTTNETTNDTANQTTNQTTNQTLNQTTNQTLNQTTNQTAGPSIFESLGDYTVYIVAVVIVVVIVVAVVYLIKSGRIDISRGEEQYSTPEEQIYSTLKKKKSPNRPVKGEIPPGEGPGIFKLE